MEPLRLEDPIPFDVDETLIGIGGSDWEITFLNPNHNIFETTTVHKGHVEAIKELKEKGHTIIVWSMSGAEYTKNVLVEIGIFDLVDAYGMKPIEYYDDQKPGYEWMALRRFLKMPV